MDGGAGIDTASYASSSEAVSVDLADAGPQSGGDASGDVLVSIENVTGSAYDDTLSGNSAANVLEGGEGADHIDAARAAIRRPMHRRAKLSTSISRTKTRSSRVAMRRATCSFRSRTLPAPPTTTPSRVETARTSLQAAMATTPTS